MPLGTLARVAAFFAALCIAPFAAAADNLHWRCWYDQQVHITCLVDEVPDTARAGAEVPLPANIPGIVKLLRKDPGAFRNRIVHVPLHTQPYDMEFTATLARATVCGSRSDCTVNFTSQLPPAEEVIALLNKHVPYLERAMPTTLAMAEID